jgi:hypothetical protein
MSEDIDKQIDEECPVITYTANGPIRQTCGVAILDPDDPKQSLLMTLANPEPSRDAGSGSQVHELVIISKTEQRHVLRHKDGRITFVGGEVGAGLRLMAHPDGRWFKIDLEDFPLTDFDSQIF